METTTTARTIHHAAHFDYGMKGANDHIVFDTISETPFPIPSEAALAGAEFHHGYRSFANVQHWVYIKAVRAAEGSTCDRCKEVK